MFAYIHVAGTILHVILYSTRFCVSYSIDDNTAVLTWYQLSI